MSVGVVDFLEAVEIDHDEDDAGFHAAGAFQGLNETVLEEAAVSEAGELIMEGQPLVGGDLVFEHDDEHADGDKELLHVPDLGDYGLPMGPVGDPGMDEKAERPDKEAAHDGNFSDVIAGEAL